MKEFLRLALFDEQKLQSNYRKILAITFTNKAAAEMKSRVLQALSAMAGADPMPYVAELLCAEIKITPGELKRRSGIVLNHILHHYSDFSIGTIDSFTHKIVKTFAYDLKLPVNFNVELDVQGFYERVIARLFNQIGEDEMVGKLLKEYVLSKAEDNTSWDPEQQIREFSKMLQKENSGDYIRQLEKFSADELIAFRDQFTDFIRFYKDTLKSKAGEALELISRNKLRDDDFSYKKSGPQNFFRKCANGMVTIDDTEGTRITEAIGQGKWAGKTSSAATSTIETIAPELGKIASGLINFIRSHYRFFSLCELLNRQMYPLMLLRKIEEISREQKQEERLVFISEFNQKISDIINNEPTPFIYERLGERYRHYLIDEFQDTSSLQWHNMLPLIDNSLANGWFNLIVGDGKQSIYRWRSADVKQFAALPEVGNPGHSGITTDRVEILKRNFEGRLLNTNYRSLRTIINFNNSLFGELSGTLLKNEHAGIYAGQTQLVKNEGEGYITLHTGKTGKDELDARTCALVVEQILAALDKGFSYNDICILCRKNYHGNIIASYLVENKIPVVSSDSLLLKHNPEVNTVIAWLRYINNKQDRISAAVVVTYLYSNAQISREQLHAYLERISGNDSVFEILKECGIGLKEENRDLNNLFDNCVEIIKALKLDVKAFHYLRFFLDEVNEFLTLKNASAAFFFEWWESRSGKASMIIPATTNAVNIMTIHASKGLEFPVVIVPFCNWQVYRAGDSWVNIRHENTALPVGVISMSRKVGDSGFEKEFETEEQDQVLDNLNLLYVAFTRAVERLHIITLASSGNKSATVADWLEQYMQRHYVASGDTYETGQALPRQGKLPADLPRLYPLAPLRFETAESAVKIKSSYMGLHEEVEEAKLQGLRLHELMSSVGTEADIDLAVENAFLQGTLPGAEITTAKEQIKKIISHDELEKYFAPGIEVRSESGLVTAEGEVLRPDRVVFTEDETVIIDYKTGKENNKKYFRQLQKYENALLSMGYKNIRKLLVYVDGPTVIAVN